MMFVCLAAVSFIGGFEDRRKGRNKMALFGFLVGVLLLLTVIVSFVRAFR